ncbi:hypothetical protein K488DRAFT_83296 [Vararia minispora EC-137]|uniref:Uncharacterized protein n=1 Tax=Vararia minispora EC-137 TaxID=1314806 RepID=A0ACB8QUF4_9AGAM|nr:hypothetical protein K488DRAFT_83296 [Vararia minispora EC-137]
MSHSSPQDQQLVVDHQAMYSVRASTPMSDAQSSGTSDISIAHGESRPHSVGADFSYTALPDTSSGASPMPSTSLEPASGRVPRVKAARPVRSTSRGMADDMDEREGAGPDSVYDAARKKKKDYAKNFRDTEKQHFEELRRRLFPRDPHARRAECLERAIQWVDELGAAKSREMQRTTEISSLRQQLAAAEQRAHMLENRLNEFLNPTQVPPPAPSFEPSTSYQPPHFWQ